MSNISFLHTERYIVLICGSSVNFFVPFFHICSNDLLLHSPAIFLSLSFKELQSSLMSRSNEVNNVAFDIQVFISERAQDLAPEQSRQLLGQLQQLQRAFHQASGQAQAWADALSAQKEREEEWQRRERLKEEEKNREMENAREREVWKNMIESVCFFNIALFLTNTFEMQQSYLSCC